MAFEPTQFKVDFIVGRVVAPAEVKFDGDQTELRLAVGHGYTKDKGTPDAKWIDTGVTFINYIAGKGHGDPLLEFSTGDLVKIENGPQLVTRNYEKDGNPKGGAVIEARFGDIVLLEAKGAGNGGGAQKGF